MKTLIAYASKSGTAKKCAEYLHGKLKDNMETNLVNLAEAVPDISLYDTGCDRRPDPCRQIIGEVKSFMAKHQNSLTDKNLYIFFAAPPANIWKNILKTIFRRSWRKTQNAL